ATANAGIVVGDGIAGSPVEEVQIWVVASCHPRCAASTRGLWPRVPAGFSRCRNRIEPPPPYSGHPIVSIDEPTRRHVSTGIADNDSVFHHQRRECCGMPLF